MKMTLNEEIELLRNGKWYDKIGGTLLCDEYLNLGWAIRDVLDTLESLRMLQPKVETNADRIRSMSDEELSKFLCEFRSCDSDGHPCSGCKADRYCYAGHTGTEDWLQQPAAEET